MRHQREKFSWCLRHVLAAACSSTLLYSQPCLDLYIINGCGKKLNNLIRCTLLYQMPRRTQFIILVPCLPRTFLPFLALTTCALSSFSAERHCWKWDRCHFAFRSVSSTLRALFPSPWPRTRSQPRVRSALSTSEGCNLLETSAMTLLLLLNSPLSCGVTWGRATNLAEPQTLKDMLPTKVTMIRSTVSSLRALNLSLSLRQNRVEYKVTTYCKHTTHHFNISTYYSVYRNGWLKAREGL